jgi:TetR/AcrR family transcriptional regulator, lmrAB and yxaGH operons repressor
MAAQAKHRQAIVDAAVTLFRQNGYAATGLADIVAASGAPKGSLYYYFPNGKAQIAEAAVREAGRRVAETVQGLAAKAASGGDLVKAHARLLAHWMAQSGYRDGSPITTVLLENAPADDAITAAGAEAQREHRRIIAERLEADGFSPRRATRLAVLATAALDGALVQARIEQSGAPLIAAAEEFAALLKDTRDGV